MVSVEEEGGGGGISTPDHAIHLLGEEQSADAAASRGKGNDLCTPFLMETSDCIQLLSLCVDGTQYNFNQKWVKMLKGRSVWMIELE